MAALGWFLSISHWQSIWGWIWGFANGGGNEGLFWGGIRIGYVTLARGGTPQQTRGSLATVRFILFVSSSGYSIGVEAATREGMHAQVGKSVAHARHAAREGVVLAVVSVVGNLVEKRRLPTLQPLGGSFAPRAGQQRRAQGKCELKHAR